MKWDSEFNKELAAQSGRLRGQNNDLMTTYYVAPSPTGSDSANGSLATPWLTWTHAETIAINAGDVVIGFPGTYREMPTQTHSGGNVYSTGTLSLTNGSAVVTGSGTAFTGNVFGGGALSGSSVLRVLKLIGGTDGATNGTDGTLTSAAGNFQASLIGWFLRIGGLGTYLISAVASATSLTVTNIDGTAATLALGTGRTYSIGPESPYDVLSVDTNTQLTLTEVWNGPTLTGVSYYCYRPIRWIGDYSGALTGATPGPVRITASDDDKTSARAYSINAHNFYYRLYQGFLFDFGGTANIGFATGCHDMTWQDCYFAYMSTTGGKLACYDAGMAAMTIRRCYFTVAYNQWGIDFHYAAAGDDGYCLVENNIFECGNTNTYGVNTLYVGDCLVRNNRIIGALWGVSSRLQNLGHATICYNNIISNAYGGFDTNNAANLCEDYNSVSGPFNNGLFSGGVAQGPHTNKYPPLSDSRWFFQLRAAGAGPNNASQVVTPFDLSSNSQLLNVAGFNPPRTDMRGTAIQGTQREWGPLEYDSTLRKDGRGTSGLLLNPGMNGGMG